MSFARWLRQPTTITGIGSLFGAISGMAADLVTGQSGVGAAVGAVVFAGVHLVVNDNSVATDAGTLAGAAVTAGLAGPVGALESVPVLAADTVKLAGDVAGLVGDTSAPPAKS